MILSERELNAFVSRHASGNELPLSEMGVRLIGNGVVELTGRLPLRALRFLPQQLVPDPLWVRLRGHVRLESSTARGDRQKLRLDVEQFFIGGRRFPVAVLGMMPGGSGLQAIRWPVPAAVESLTVEAGRLTVTTRP